MLIDENFADINKRKHNRFTVRKIGSTFSPYDKYRGAFLLPNADLILMTRESEHAYHPLAAIAQHRRGTAEGDIEVPSVQRPFDLSPIR